MNLDRLALKIPPPVQTIMVAALMYAVRPLWPNGAWQLPAAPWWLLAFVVAALVIGLAALTAFGRAGTTKTPLHPERASQIVRSGIYAHSRNPMYLALLLLLAAWAVWCGHLLSWLGLPLLVWSLTRLQIVPEERILTAKFGAEYTAYQAQVRRWL